MPQRRSTAPLTVIGSPGRARRVWRDYWWRTLVLIVVFAAGLSAFLLGVETTERQGIADGHLLTKVYYTLGLFVLGGLDLGVPQGGPAFAQGLLWVAYFAAPAITASALLEGILRLLEPHRWTLSRLEHHIVIAGTGELSTVYLRRLRSAGVTLPVVVVEVQASHPNLDLFTGAFKAKVIIGNIASETLLATLRLERAERIVLLTGDDFTNLNAASSIIHRYPELAPKVLLHVGDLAFMRAVSRTRVGQECEVFNTLQLAASHLVQTDVLEHFQRTDHYDTVVLAGFGRFGQTVLDELQRSMRGEFDRVIIVDLRARQHAMTFETEIGFASGYERLLIDGDLRDPGVWRELLSQAGQAPLILLSSSDDSANLHTALLLKSRVPKAHVIVRSFARSAFAEELAREKLFTAFNVASLVSESIPDRWLTR